MVTVPDWINEFGEEYAVPEIIWQAEGITDHSWHNDISPSFGRFIPEHGDEYAHDLRIWVEHPDGSGREFGPAWDRFVVTYRTDRLEDEIPGVIRSPDDLVYTGNDPAAALAAFMDALGLIYREVKRRG